jgi:hypothetical protein
MERLGFLQLAKRFLQLGKESPPSPAPPEDDRFIQPRPPASRTLSLKLFTRATGGGGENNGVVAADRRNDDQLPRSAARKKFHSVKEGALSRAGARSKENADPQLRIASVGRKHVFRSAGGGGVPDAVAVRQPPRTLLYQAGVYTLENIPLFPGSGTGVPAEAVWRRILKEYVN